MFLHVWYYCSIFQLLTSGEKLCGKTTACFLMTAMTEQLLLKYSVINVKC